MCGNPFFGFSQFVKAKFKAAPPDLPLGWASSRIHNPLPIEKTSGYPHYVTWLGFLVAFFIIMAMATTGMHGHRGDPIR